MLRHVGRRTFLIGASIMGLAAASAKAATNGMLGHVKVGRGLEAVLVLHEWMGDHGNYDPVVPYLSSERYTYVFADLRGYGLSRGLAGAYTAAEAAGDALALMDHLGFSRFHLVGHSMSGMLVQYLMATAPQRVDRVVAISPVPADGFKADAAGLARLNAIIDDDEAARKAIDARTGSRYGRAWLDRKLAVARATAPEVMRGYLAMFTGTDFSARVTGLATPITAIVGAQDIPFYRRAAVEPKFSAWYPQLRVAEIHDAGHYSMLETPVLLAALIEQGLSAAPTR